MKHWSTEIKAKSPINGQMSTYAGPDIKAPTLELAQEYCEKNGLGYCWVIGELIMDIPCIEGTLDPDWDKAIDYTKPQDN